VKEVGASACCSRLKDGGLQVEREKRTFSSSSQEAIVDANILKQLYKLLLGQYPLETEGHGFKYLRVMIHKQWRWYVVGTRKEHDKLEVI
jgi:hypothetical protein